MFRDDILWFIPAVLIAFYQVKFIWKKLPLPDPQETEIEGQYTDVDKLRFDYGVRWLAFIMWVQIVIPLFTITKNSGLDFSLKILGYSLIITGFIAAFLALKALGSNWTGMSDYRIKKGQQLVSTGIYKFIRHPIYLGAILEVVGFELLANSWLAIVFAVILFKIIKSHAKKEEELLEKKFGKHFLEYKGKTKMFIPFIY